MSRNISPRRRLYTLTLGPCSRSPPFLSRTSGQKFICEDIYLWEISTEIPRWSRLASRRGWNAGPVEFPLAGETCITPISLALNFIMGKGEGKRGTAYKQRDHIPTSALVYCRTSCSDTSCTFAPPLPLMLLLLPFGESLRGCCLDNPRRTGRCA